MPITQFILDKALSEVYGQLKSYLKKRNLSLTTDSNYTRETILNHISYVSNWSKQIDFKDSKKAKAISKIYIDLDYYLNLKRDSLSIADRERIELGQILEESDKHIVVLGQPGAGKTTTMKHVCQSIFYEEKFHPEFSFPILIRLRDLSEDSFSTSKDLLFDRLFSTLGLKLEIKEDTKFDYSVITIRECVVKMADYLGVIIILDGFDEINPPGKKKKIIKEFEYLCLHLTRSRVILTSRIGDYHYSIDNTEVYEISSLTAEQIKLFTKKWLGDHKKSTDLHNEILNSPFYDTAIRPLTMAHLCA